MTQKQPLGACIRPHTSACQMRPIMLLEFWQVTESFVVKINLSKCVMVSFIVIQCEAPACFLILPLQNNLWAPLCSHYVV